MVKLPPWDTLAWRLPRELRPLYAAVNRVRDLEATPVHRSKRSPQPAVPLLPLRSN
jgi:hypothetical protein